MGVKAVKGLMGKQAPTWLTWLMLGGLVAVYFGERVLNEVGLARLIMSGGGALLVLVVWVWRLISWRSAQADARSVQALFFLTASGCALGLIGFFLASNGAGVLGLDLDELEAAPRFKTSAAVLASILLSVSLLPELAAQWAIGAAPRDRRETTAVDRLRITQLAAAGLTVGLAGCFLVLTGWIASKRDKTFDLSYFRTASPGTAVRQIVESRPTPLRVLLFFPPANEVKDQVAGYFHALDAAARNVTIEEHDRLASPELAQQYEVTQDGAIVLAYGDRSENITLPIRLREARNRLRAFDSEVQRALMRAAREQRTIYVTVGHGELNDPNSRGPAEEAPFRSIDALRRLFGLLNYRVSDLGIHNGLGNEVPADAAIVLVLGPARSFLEPELQSLDRYLARGGSVLLALEPEGAFQMGPLRQRLGVDYHAVRLADDQQHVRWRGNLADRRLIVTDRFSSHAALATLGRVGVGSGTMMMGAGYLAPADSTAAPTFVVQSLPSTFADRDGDFEFDDKTEERKMYPLVAAIDLGGAQPVAPDSAANNTAGARAMVFADAELFSDAVVTSLGLNAALAADAVRWLGREESLGGETRSEEDVPIVHTRAENVVWFHSTILGAPALVLLLGLLGVRRRRRAASKSAESTPPAAEPAVAAYSETVSTSETVNR